MAGLWYAYFTALFIKKQLRVPLRFVLLFSLVSLVFVLDIRRAPAPTGIGLCAGHSQICHGAASPASSCIGAKM